MGSNMQNEEDYYGQTQKAKPSSGGGDTTKYGNSSPYPPPPPYIPYPYLPDKPPPQRKWLYFVIAGLLLVIGILVGVFVTRQGSSSSPTPTATVAISTPTFTVAPTSTVQPTQPPPTQVTSPNRLLRFNGDPNKDSQILGVSLSDLLQRAASGDGWQVDNVKFKVYYHTCVDMDAGLSDQDVQSRIQASIEWISHDIPGVTRTFIAGNGTAQGPATIYSESSSCPPR